MLIEDKQFSLLSHKNSLKLIMNSKIGINSAENFYTFFMMDCINSGTHVLCDKKTASSNILFKKKIILSDYEKLNFTCNKLLKFL